MFQAGLYNLYPGGGKTALIVQEGTSLMKAYAPNVNLVQTNLVHWKPWRVKPQVYMWGKHHVVSTKEQGNTGRGIGKENLTLTSGSTMWFTTRGKGNQR